MSPRRIGALAALAALAAPVLTTTAGTGPAAAAADGDSIVYLKDGRVWIAHADGTGARAFTQAAYGWSSPSEDDNGDVVVLGGLSRVNPDGTDSDGSSEIYRFAPDGNQIGQPIPTWGSYSSPACPTYPPNSARVSPDGSKVAYGIWECASASYTALWTPTSSTGLNFPNQSLGQEDFYEPQWVDSSHFMVSHAGTTVTDTQARFFVHAVTASDDEGPGWYDDRFTGTGVQGLVSRSGTSLAVFEDDAADYFDGTPRHVTLHLYSSSSLATAEADGWTFDCSIELDAAATSDPFHLSPSFSTDGSKVYWGDDEGVEVLDVGERSSACASGTPRLLIPGGSQPFVSDGGIHTPADQPNQPGVQHSPSARFTFSPTHPRAGRVVTFDGRASYETLGRIASYSWRLGDGHSATGSVAKHTFAKPGSYRVRLTVTDNHGRSARISKTVTVARR
jgi:hypothetical protein